MSGRGRYAGSTSVPVERSRAEIEGILKRYGATEFGYGWGHKGEVVAFVYEGRQVRLVLPNPTKDDDIIKLTPTGKLRPDGQLQDEIAKERRRRWRALGLVIKAKLEAVETGIADFSDEFLAYTLLPSGHTIGQVLRPQLDQVARTGRMPALGITYDGPPPAPPDPIDPGPAEPIAADADVR